MHGSTMLMAANAAVWVGIVIYVLILSRKHVRLENRLRQLEKSGHAQRDFA